MSLIPTFEVGLWNAWILVVVFLLLVYIPVLTLKDFNKKMGQGEHYGRIETFMMALTFVLIIYAIFLPLKLGTAWFYAGLFINLTGLIILAVTIVNVALTPLGETFTKGIYRYSRNPGYIGQVIVFIGIGVATASWLYLLLSAVLAVLTYLLIDIEERITLDKLGETYRQYMSRTPRWFGIPKVMK